MVSAGTGSRLDTDQRTAWRHVLALALAVSAGAALLLAAFAWPVTQVRPREVPIAVVGPPPAVAQLTAAVGGAQPGAFDLVPAPDAGTARAMVRDRDVDGVLLLGSDGATAVVASQGAPAVAQAVTALARVAAGSPEPPVEDLAPLPAGDPRGGALAAAVLPVAVAGAVGGMLLAVRVRGAVRRAAGALLLAALAGPAFVAVLHGWLGALTGDVWAEVGVASLGVGATALGVVGAHAVAGRIGLVLAELTVIALGNPLSGAASSPRLLPDGWAELGQALPPGAVVSALRAVSGFDGAGTGGPLLVLGCWAAGGLLLLVARAAVAGRGRRRGVDGATGPSAAAAPALVRSGA